MPRYLYFSLLLILLSACAISPAAQTALPAWHYADLRAIDAPEGDTSFSLPDLLAVYTREVTDTVQIRLDFLDLTPNADYTLFLALDTREGGKPVEELVPRYFSLSALFISQAEGANQSRWDNLIVVPFNDPVSVIDASGNLTYDPSLAVERDS